MRSVLPTFDETGLSGQRAELTVFRRPKITLLSLCKGKV